MSNLGIKNYNDRLSRNFFQDVECGDDTTPYRGLYNEGSTCYINSLLQTLFSIGKFRSSIFRLQSDKASKVRQLQRIFYNLQIGRENVRCYELLKSFGYSDAQLKIQQDASEFQLYLNSILEEQLKGTEEERVYQRLFYGEKESVLKCTQIEYESVKKESFTVL